MPLKKDTKPNVSKLKKRADQAWSQYIRLRDSDKDGLGICITCGVRKHWKELQNGHFVSRQVNVLRYDPENCNSQCYSCNVMRYGEQYKYAKELDLKYGDGTADKLYAQRFATHKFTPIELETIIAETKEAILAYYHKH